MMMPGRKFSTGSGYRYGFNGKENDNEVKGEGNQLDFGSRIYDGRLGRWLSVDPLQSKYTSLSPYNFCGNSPIFFVDPNGKEIRIYLSETEYFVYKPGIKPEVDKHLSSNALKAANEAFQQIQASYTYSKNSKIANEIWNDVMNDGRILKVVLNPNMSDNGQTTNFVPKALNQGTTSEYFLGTLTWDNNSALEFLFQPGIDIDEEIFNNGVNKGEITPTTALIHDLGHVKLWLDALKSKDPAAATAKLSDDKMNSSDKQYRDKAERALVTGIESQYIREINAYELSLNTNSEKLQPIRFNYDITIMPNNSTPITNPNNFHNNSQSNFSYTEMRKKMITEKRNPRDTPPKDSTQ